MSHTCSVSISVDIMELPLTTSGTSTQSSFRICGLWFMLYRIRTLNVEKYAKPGRNQYRSTFGIKRSKIFQRSTYPKSILMEFGGFITIIYKQMNFILGVKINRCPQQPKFHIYCRSRCLELSLQISYQQHEQVQKCHILKLEFSYTFSLRGVKASP